MCVKGNLTSMHQSGLLSCFFKGWDLGLPWQFPGGDNGKESACQCRRCEFDSWVGKIPWRRKWQPTPVFLPGGFHGQRSLAGYSPGGRKESDMIERLNTHTIVWIHHTSQVLLNISTHFQFQYSRYRVCLYTVELMVLR